MEGGAAKLAENKERLLEFTKVCEDGVQLSLKLWNALPKTTTKDALLHVFQQFVELAEASQIQSNLATTSISNIDTKSQELRGILQTWRERLPNVWDDVNIWSDLVSWRQHVFSSINRAYLPLIPLLSKPHGRGIVGIGVGGGALWCGATSRSLRHLLIRTLTRNAHPRGTREPGDVVRVPRLPRDGLDHQPLRQRGPQAHPG
jgi:hypothetical protein